MPVLRRACCALVAAAAAFALPVAAQSYPVKPVRLLVPFPPGGATDIVARMVATKMQDVWGQSVVIDNRPGAGTVLATDLVAKATPDGYTLGFVITAHVINPSLRNDLPYDTLRDLAAVTLISRQHLALAASPGLEANTIPELIALAKKQPGKLAYGSPGSGTSLHLAMELFKLAAGIDIVHVPYKGGAIAQQDAMGGRLALVADVHYALASNVKSGRLKMIAMLSAERPAYAREYPVLAETVPGVSGISIVGIVAPGATPKELVRRIAADFERGVKSPDLTERMTAQGMEPVGSTPEAFDALIRAEMEKWGKVVKSTGIKAD